MGTIVRIVGSLVGGYHLVGVCGGGGRRCKQPIEESEDNGLILQVQNSEVGGLKYWKQYRQ